MELALLGRRPLDIPSHLGTLMERRQPIHHLVMQGTCRHDVAQGTQHERTLPDPRVGDREIFSIQGQIAIEQDIEIDHPGSPPFPRHSSERNLNVLQFGQQPSR